MDLIVDRIEPDHISRSAVETIKLAAFAAYIKAIHARHQGRRNYTVAGGMTPLQGAVHIEGIDTAVLRAEIDITAVIQHR